MTSRVGSPRLILRREATLLDTGGGVVAALGDLGAVPFFVINGDSVWFDGAAPALARLADAWDDTLDAVLLLHRTSGAGDFWLDPAGRIRRRRIGEGAPCTYAGVQLLHPRLFADAPAGAFSLNLLWDRAIAADRVRAIVHDGAWFHLSTPADLVATERVLRAAHLAAEQ